MKKILLIILLMCFFVVSWVSAECTDTDGGINIYENGEIHFINPYEESANSGSSGGGGNGGTCPSDYTCEDGTQVEYCKMVMTETYECPTSTITTTTVSQNATSGGGGVMGSCPKRVTIKCECIDNPSSLCNTPSQGDGGGGGSSSSTLPSDSSGGGSKMSVNLDECFNNQDCDDINPCSEDLCTDFPKKCTHHKIEGCIVDNKCFSHGTIYELENKKYYCDISNKGILQKQDEVECNNAFECKSNICEKNQCGRFCEGCKDESMKCISYGLRLENGKYCDVDNSIKYQKSNQVGCNNNYECTSNLCVNDKCIEPNLLNKLINWLRKFFGE